MYSIKDATLLFVKLSEPVETFDKKGKQYEFMFAVDEDTFDKWNAKYKKQAGKVIPTAEFKDKYKIDPPFPAAKKQYILKLTKKLKGTDADEKYRVRAYSGEDDITARKISNGSKATVVFDDFSSEYGTFARPVSLKVTEFIEYTPKGKSDEPF